MNNIAAKTFVAVALLGLLHPSGAIAGDFGMSMERMRGNIEYLSSDELGGRAPGSADTR